MLQFDLVDFALLVVLPGGARCEGVVVVETDLVEGRGIRSHCGLAGYRHGRWGTLLDDQDAFPDADVHRKPVGPVPPPTPGQEIP